MLFMTYHLTAVNQHHIATFLRETTGIFVANHFIVFCIRATQFRSRYFNDTLRNRFIETKACVIDVTALALLREERRVGEVSGEGVLL